MSQETRHEELPRTSWHTFFESVSREHQGHDVTMEVLSLDYGDQYEAERLPLFAVEYDSKDDAVIVSVGGRDGRYPVLLRHIIRQPRRIMVAPRPHAELALDVVAADNTQTLLTISGVD